MPLPLRTVLGTGTPFSAVSPVHEPVPGMSARMPRDSRENRPDQWVATSLPRRAHDAQRGTPREFLAHGSASDWRKARGGIEAKHPQALSDLTSEVALAHYQGYDWNPRLDPAIRREFLTLGVRLQGEDALPELRRLDLAYALARSFCGSPSAELMARIDVRDFSPEVEWMRDHVARLFDAAVYLPRTQVWLPGLERFSDQLKQASERLRDGGGLSYERLIRLGDAYAQTVGSMTTEGEYCPYPNFFSIEKLVGEVYPEILPFPNPVEILREDYAARLSDPWSAGQHVFDLLPLFRVRFFDGNPSAQTGNYVARHDAYHSQAHSKALKEIQQWWNRDSEKSVHQSMLAAELQKNASLIRRYRKFLERFLDFEPLDTDPLVGTLQLKILFMARRLRFRESLGGASSPKARELAEMQWHLFHHEYHLTAPMVFRGLRQMWVSAMQARRAGIVDLRDYVENFIPRTNPHFEFLDYPLRTKLLRDLEKKDLNYLLSRPLEDFSLKEWVEGLRMLLEAYEVDW